MPDGGQLTAARATRRAMRGDAYVDAQTGGGDAGDTDPVASEFQDCITSAYCGAAAGISARRNLLTVRAEREKAT